MTNFTHNQSLYTIGVVSQMFNLTPETLRLYEREGLILPKRSETGRRFYSEYDLEWIACVRHLITDEKLNLAGIRRLLALIPCWIIKPCTVKERKKCPAFYRNDQACWNLSNRSDTCVGQDCHECNVYHTSCHVESLKDYLMLQLKDFPRGNK